MSVLQWHPISVNVLALVLLLNGEMKIAVVCIIDQVGLVQLSYSLLYLLAMNCPDKQCYDVCGSSCPKTCYDTSYNCENDHCIEGCHCPEGKEHDLSENFHIQANCM